MLKPIIKKAWHHLPLKLPMLRIVRALTTLPHWLYQHLHFHGDFDVDVAPGARFRIRSYACGLENDLFWAGYGGNVEKVSFAIWRELCREAKTMLDVGANTGVYALAAAALRPDAQVIAFEPVSRVCDRLRVNVALNSSNIVVENVAVSDRSGVATLYDTDTEHVYSASLEYEMLGEAYTRSYEVPTVTLDEYCATNGIRRVDLIKIDVERHEPAVVRGAKRVLEKNRPSILVEVLTPELGSELMEAIAGLGYAAYELHDRAAEGGVECAARLGGADRNYLICQPETARRLGLPEAAPFC